MAGGGGTLSAIHQSARKLLLRTRDGLERLERLDYSSNSSSNSDLSFAIHKDITQIQSLCVDMNRLFLSISAKPQRDLWKRQILSYFSLSRSLILIALALPFVSVFEFMNNLNEILTENADSVRFCLW